MDGQQRRTAIYVGIGLVIVIILALVAYGVFNSQSNLPPVEDSETQNSSASDEPSEATPSAPPEDSSVVKDGVTFTNFNNLLLYAITSSRVEVITFTLAQYARENSITTYTFDAASLRETAEGERRIFTFNTEADNDKTYKVELSYVYSADAHVRVFDGDKVVQTSY